MISPNQSCDLMKQANTFASSSIASTPTSGFMLEKQCLMSPSISSHQSSVTCATFPPRHQPQVPISPISFSSLKGDNELLSQLTPDELIYRVKTLEVKNRMLLFDNGCLIKDINKNLANIQLCRHQLAGMKKDNNELRDLCCYLDDERTRAREIAREWETFGDHMSKVLKQEIQNYNKKLNQLESKQFELIKENYELKQLCLLLDKATNCKIDTDTKSDLTNDDETIKCLDAQTTNESTGETTSRQRRKSLLNCKILNYIKLLENKLDQFEEEREQLGKQMKTDSENLSSTMHNEDEKESQSNEKKSLKCSIKELKENYRPEELRKAMEVLSIEESLNNESDFDKKSCQVDGHQDNVNCETIDGQKFESNDDNIINEDQKFIIKQLCSAAYKKIEDE